MIERIWSPTVFDEIKKPPLFHVAVPSWRQMSDNEDYSPLQIPLSERVLRLPSFEASLFSPVLLKYLFVLYRVQLQTCRLEEELWEIHQEGRIKLAEWACEGQKSGSDYIDTPQKAITSGWQSADWVNLFALYYPQGPSYILAIWPNRGESGPPNRKHNRNLRVIPPAYSLPSGTLVPLPA